MFSLPFVCLPVSKITQKQNFMKLGGEVEHGQRKNPLKFGVDPDHFI